MKYKIILSLLFISCFSCNKYEVSSPSVTLKINVINKVTNEPFENYKGILRTSNFDLSQTSACFYEDSTTIRFDSTFSNSSGDLVFEIPYVNDVPQSYYQLRLSKDLDIPLRLDRLLTEYVQCDTFRIGDLVQLNVEIKNNTKNLIAFNTRGYKDLTSYKKDSIDNFIRPDYIARIGSTPAENTTLSRLLPYELNKIIVLQVIDLSISPPILIDIEVLELMKDSINTYKINL